ncbi:MAG: hypothetical protein Q7S26_01590 [bacterium]|nr:hypothetical protein [bacterium]
MDALLEPALCHAYGLSSLLVSKALLDLLKPTLSAVELEYVEVDGPEIVRQHYFHDVYTEQGGCPEGRAAGQEAKRLEQASKEKLDAAGVSPERQLLLADLLFGADAAFSSSFPPWKIENIVYHLSSRFRQGKSGRLKELAQVLKAPSEISYFVSLVHEQAAKLVAAKERERKEQAAK